MHVSTCLTDSNLVFISGDTLSIHDTDRSLFMMIKQYESIQLYKADWYTELSGQNGRHFEDDISKVFLL